MNPLRTPLIAGNWKLFKTGAEGAAFIQGLAESLGRRLGDAPGVEVVVAPPFTSLYQVAQACGGTKIEVAAQDVYWEENGAFTGEVAPHMVKDAGAAWAIVGIRSAASSSGKPMRAWPARCRRLWRRG